MLIFAVTAIWLILGILTFAKFVELTTKKLRLWEADIFLFSSPKICLIYEFMLEFE